MTQYSTIENFTLIDTPINTLFVRYEPWECKYLIINSEFRKNCVIRVDERIKCITFMGFKFRGDIRFTLSDDYKLIIEGNRGINGFCIVSLQDRFNSNGFINIRSINIENVTTYDYVMFYNMTVDMSRHKYMEDCEMDVWKKFRLI